MADSPDQSPVAELTLLSKVIESDSLGNLDGGFLAPRETEKRASGESLSGMSAVANPSDTSLVTTNQATLEAIRKHAHKYPRSKSTRYRRTKFERLSHPDRMKEFHKALHTSGPVHAVTLNLSPEIEAKARREAEQGRSPLVYLQKRIRRELKQAGLPATFWIMQEEAEVDSYEALLSRVELGLPGNKRLHLHGEMRCSKADATAVRAALRKAGGLWDEHRQYQAVLSEDPDEGWLQYLQKDNWKQWPWLKARAQGEGFCGTQITGKSYSVTDDLRDLAAASYNEMRGQRVWSTRA